MRVVVFAFLILNIFSCSKKEASIPEVLNSYIYEEIPLEEKYLKWNLDSLIYTAGQTPDPFKKVEYSRAAGIRLLNANRNEKAWHNFMTVRNIARRMITLRDQFPESQHLLALAYLKTASSRTKINTSNFKKSLKETGELQDASMLDKSQKIYEDLIKENSKDEKAIFLLNYILLNKGQYPNGLSEDLRVIK